MARWQDYEEKDNKVSSIDELLISSWWIVKKIKALQFKWEKWEKWEQGLRWTQGLQGPKWDTWPIWPAWPRWEQGLRWKPWETWPKWEKWEAFKFSDFTPEQLEALKVKWEKWEIWPPWPRWQKWEKWEPWDTWPVWPAWRDWTWSWDMLASNNLSDLVDKIEARKNLEVFSKYETWKKIENELKKEWFADYEKLNNKPDLENLLNWKVDKIRWKVLSDNNFTNAEKEKLASLNNSPTIDESNLVHKNGDEVISWSKTFEKRWWTAWIKFKNLNTNKNYEIWVNAWWEFILWDTQNSKNRIRSKDNWFEIWAIPTTTESQSDWWHSLVRKDYVDRKIREISNSGWFQKVFDSWEIRNDNFLIVRHNLNLSEEDYFSGKYLIVIKSKNSDWIETISSDTTRMLWNSYATSSDWRIQVHTNQISFYISWWPVRVLIFKRF